MSQTARHLELPLLVFDGDCAFCRRCVQFMQRHFKKQPRISSWQSLDLTTLGLTQLQCEGAVQWVNVNGAIHSAHAAIAHTLIFAGKGWALLGHIILLPGIKQIAGIMYRQIANNRACVGTPRGRA